MTQPKALKPKQLNAIKLLATGTPAYQVAARLEITTMTLYRWQRLPEFEQTLHSISHSGLDEIATKMNVAALTAVETLQEILCSLNEPTNIRLKAAIGTLRAMPSVNGALEKGLQHRTADFDTRRRFHGPAFTHGSDGRPYPYVYRQHHRANAEVMPMVVEV